MSRPRKVLPRYLAHSSGKARAVWTDSSGLRRERQLPGPFNSPESLQAFARLQLELASSPAQTPTTTEGPAVVEILIPFVKHAEAYYGPSSELAMYKDAIKIVRELYGMEPVAEFGPRKLAAVREAFRLKGWTRGYINRQVGKIVRAFKWAASEELIPTATYQALKTLAPLRRGHCDAPDPEPRQPANPADVDATIPHLLPHVRAIVELLRLTGMRPAEACGMTLGQIDRSGPVWFYRPVRHKNAFRGQARTVALGSSAQAVIVGHTTGRTIGDTDPLFSPIRQRDEKFVELRAKRKNPVQPSQRCRKKLKPKQLPGEWFTPEAVGHAVKRAALLAGVPVWTPYQLRHLKGAELREQFSLEHVRAALGHSHASMSAHYSTGADGKLAAEVAAKAG